MSDTDTLLDTETLVLVPVDDLEPAVDNPRRDLGDLDELTASVKSIGVLEPLVVRSWTTSDDGKTHVVAGHRRLAAARQAGLDTVPCRVMDLDDAQALEAALVENLQRQNLDPLEEAAAYRRLTTTHGHSQRDLARRIGVSQGHISKRLSLLKLPDDVQAKVDAGTITVGEAVELAKLADDPDRLKTAVNRGQSQWSSIEDEVKGQLREVKREKQVAELRAKADRGGTPFVDYDDVALYVSDNGGPVPIYRLEGSYVVDDHDQADCHAVTIPSHGHPELEAVCTDPTSHDKRQLELTEQQAERRATREAEDAADEARHAAVAPAVNAADTETHIRWAAVLEAYRLNRRKPPKGLATVCDHLNVDAGDDPLAALCDYARSSTAAGARLLAYSALEAAAHHVGGHIGSRENLAYARETVTFLTVGGWEATDLETGRLDDIEQRIAEREEADGG